jgi:hypothetical protein
MAVPYNPLGGPSNGNELVGKISDLESIRKYLKHNGVLSLLGNIPAVGEMKFVKSTARTKGRPMELLVGYHKDLGNSIIAQLSLQGEIHKIFFYEQREAKRLPISAEKIREHDLVNPFSKMIPSGAKVAYIAMYYFIAKGIAKDVVLRDFHPRVQEALENIGSSTELGIVETPNVTANGDLSEEDRIVHDLRPLEAPTTELMSPPHTAKRAAEDAEDAEDAKYAKLFDLSQRERTLQLLLHRLDDDLNVKKNELDALSQRRGEVDAERDSVKEAIRNFGDKRRRV